MLGFVVTLSLLQIAVIIAAAEMLVRGLPKHLLASAKENCQRLDGTISNRRTRREFRAKRKLRSDLWAIFVCLALAGNASLWSIHEFVIPLPLGLAALAEFDVDQQKWADNVHAAPIEERFGSWLQSKHQSKSSLQTRVSMLWDAWPLIAAFALTLAIAGCVLVQRGYRRALREYVDGVEQRAEKYAKRDLARMPLA